MPLHSVAPGVYLIDLPWVNAWLITAGEDGMLIDTGTCRDRRHLMAAIRQALPPDARISTVLLTHGHCDHAGNAAWLAREQGARLHAHEAERPFIESRRTYIPHGIAGLSLRGALFLLGEVLFPVERAPVHVGLQEGDSIETPIGPLKALHTPGHTPGHTAYFQEEKGWLFSGDALINVIPFLRRTGLSVPLRVFSTDMPQALESCRRIAALGPSALFPGHGWPLLENTAETIRRFMARQLQIAKPAPDAPRP